MTNVEPDLPCQLFVELVTDYLDGALSADETRRLIAHLAECPGCEAALEQFRVTIRLVGPLPTDAVESAASVDPSIQASLVHAFSEWARDRSAS